jgi:hypothetical protein
MPILPENRSRYPKNWKSVVVPFVWARSGGRCECTGQCGKHRTRCNAKNGARGAWIKPGRFQTVHWNWPFKNLNGSMAPDLVTIVLTVMHLDHQPEHCEPENLLHGCQRCHNAYDAPHRRETRRSRKAVGDLFGGTA